MKYELTPNTITIKGKTLYRIRALKDFSQSYKGQSRPQNIVRAGDLGGYIESEKNLSQDGNAWVSDNARIYEDGFVSGNAWIRQNAKVYGSARVYGSALVRAGAVIRKRAQVYGAARIYGRAQVYGDAHVGGTAMLYGKVRICGTACVQKGRLKGGHIGEAFSGKGVR